MAPSATNNASSIGDLVSQHLTEGSDDRLHLSKAGLNKYHVAPRVEPATTIQRAFCTCSPPSVEGFQACCDILPKMQTANAEEAQEIMDGLRQRLKTGLGLKDTKMELVFHPSGTDAEYIPLLYAAQRAEKQGCSQVVNVIAAAGEVGSHTATAAKGTHISHVLPLGGDCVLNEPVEGFSVDKIKVCEVMPRSDVGGIVMSYDQAMMDAVNEAEATCPGGYYILHAALSKTGLLLPSHGVIEEIQSRFQDRLTLVFDACQLRASDKEVKYWMDRDAMMLVTGSKFYGGPGFCGAVVCPPAVTEELATNPYVPAGLSGYLYKTDVPKCMTALRNGLTNSSLNIGLALRWVCALTEMEKFNLSRDVYHAKIPEWVTGVRDSVAKYAPYLELLGDENQSGEGHMGGWNTVIGIKMCVQGMGELNITDLKRVHVLLRKDMSKEMPPSCTAAEKEAVRTKCFIGQPVWLGAYGVMRIALGAPNTRCWDQEDGVASCLKDDDYILRKWATLTKYFKELSC